MAKLKNMMGSRATKQPFVARAASGKVGSVETFAAICPKVRFGPKFPSWIGNNLLLFTQPFTLGSTAP